MHNINKFKTISIVNKSLYQPMRKLSFFFLVAFFLQACNGSESVEVGNKTTMYVNSVYDAGTVMKGELISATFKVKNTGSYPLVIADVKPSCSCTVVNKPDEPIRPGEEANIKAEVNTSNTSSAVLTKSVRIVANTEPSVTEVVIKAKIKSN
jgi:hypothetical protein